MDLGITSTSGHLVTEAEGFERFDTASRSRHEYRRNRGLRPQRQPLVILLPYTARMNEPPSIRELLDGTFDSAPTSPVENLAAACAALDIEMEDGSVAATAHWRVTGPTVSCLSPMRATSTPTFKPTRQASRTTCTATRSTSYVKSIGFEGAAGLAESAPDKDVIALNKTPGDARDSGLVRHLDHIYRDHKPIFAAVHVNTVG